MIEINKTHVVPCLTMIEYPGFVKNVDKAELTLGGLEAMQKIISSDKDRLQLRFRVSDPLSHPTYGDKMPTKSLLIKIRRRLVRRPQQSSTKCSDYSDDSYNVRLVGVLLTTFKFNCLAEFQWLPMIRINKIDQPTDTELALTQKLKHQISNKTTKKPCDLEEPVSAATKVQSLFFRRTKESKFPTYKSVLDDSLPIKNPFDDTVRTLNPDCPLLVLPAVFSRFITPRETVHQPPKFRSKEMRDEFERQQKLAIIGRTRKKRATMSYRLNYNDQVPSEAPKKLIEERNVLSKEESIALPKIRDKFEEQKVWSKAALCYNVGCSGADIKYILPLVAFHYVTGPFRTMWVKYGYDPHKDKTSKVLQTLDFRVKHAGGGDNIDANESQYSRRSIHQYQLPLKRGIDKSKTKTNTTINTIEMFKFREDIRPPARQMSYQLKDIEVDEIQAIIHANDGVEPNECSEKDGWLPDGTINQIRKIMNDIMSKMFINLSDSMMDFDSIDPGSPLLIEYE